MLEAFAASTAAFVSTNLDDLFILMMLFAQTDCPKGKGAIVAGQYLGLAMLTAGSLVGAAGLGMLPGGYVRLLGLVPIGMGLRAWHGRGGEEALTAKAPGVLAVAALTVANGGDNLGVYLPLFARFDAGQRAVCAAVFAVLCGLWCLLGAKLAALPRVQAVLQSWKGVLVPLVLILLGLSILFL